MALFKKTPLIAEEAQQRIVAAIKAAEAGTTGEVRVFVESRCTYMDAFDRAREIFTGLRMYETERRNAVLVYLAVKDRQFALFGDDAIFEKAGGPVFWEAAALHMQQALRDGRFAEGIETCISELGKALAAHFPYDPSVDRNELPDEIVFGK